MPKCRRVAPAGRRLAGVSPASVRSFAKPRPDYASSNHTPALRASRNQEALRMQAQAKCKRRSKKLERAQMELSLIHI